ncbi:MAG: matrixin family metalloprotease [Arcobacteraceae bacterium]
MSKKELRIIIDEIEQQFESQLGMNIFDYSNSGKPIDIVYVAPAQVEKRIKRKLELLERKKQKIEYLKEYFPSKQKELEELRQELRKVVTQLNQKTKSLNKYISKANKKQNITQDEYDKVKAYVSKQQKLLKAEQKLVKKEQSAFEQVLSSYNRKIFSYNNLIREHNFLNNEIIRLSRSMKKVKGKTFGFKEVSLKTYSKDGKKVREKSTKSIMNKIEIYGFESKEQLKAVLAHEIAHLVGIPHINVKGALMNPILQENQIKKLFLIDADIKNFKRNF